MQKKYQTREAMLNERSDMRTKEMKTIFLKMIARSYAWTVRNEMTPGKKDRLDLYGRQIVMDKDFKSVTVVNNKGRVISAISRKSENADFGLISHPYCVSADSTVINKINDDTWIIASPVTDMNDRIGTVIINYGAK